MNESGEQQPPRPARDRPWLLMRAFSRLWDKITEQRYGITAI